MMREVRNKAFDDHSSQLGVHFSDKELKVNRV